MSVGEAKYQNPNVDHHYAYLFVSKDGSIISFYGQAAAKRKFICSFLSHNFSCPEGHQRLGRRCYKIHHQNVTWFDARNICLKEKGSDLANCETGIPSLISERGRYDEYWIGLRRERWIWYNGLRYYADMEYPNWDDGNPSATEKSKCLCLRVINGKWRNCDCMQTYRYICIQAYASGSASTVTASTAKMTTATAEPNTIQSTTTSIHTVGDSSSQFHSDNPPDPLDPWQTSGMILALGIGSACLLILIVVIVVVVFTKNRRSRSGDVGPMNGNSSPPTMHKDDAPNTVYAVVMPNANEPVRSPSEKTINQTVYAELDLEPKRKVAHRASEPVRSLSEKASNQAVYEEVVQKGNRGPTHERAVPESEYANSSLVDSVYANSAQPKV